MFARVQRSLPSRPRRSSTKPGARHLSRIEAEAVRTGAAASKQRERRVGREEKRSACRRAEAKTKRRRGARRAIQRACAARPTAKEGDETMAIREEQEPQRQETASSLDQEQLGTDSWRIFPSWRSSARRSSDGQRGPAVSVLGSAARPRPHDVQGRRGGDQRLGRRAGVITGAARHQRPQQGRSRPGALLG